MFEKFIKSLETYTNKSLIEAILSGYKTIFEDRLNGGRADNKKTSDFDKTQLKMGVEIEKEHTGDKKTREEIAMDHLEEFPENYYTELKKMETKLEK